MKKSFKLLLAVFAALALFSSCNNRVVGGEYFVQSVETTKLYNMKYKVFAKCLSTDDIECGYATFYTVNLYTIGDTIKIE